MINNNLLKIEDVLKLNFQHIKEMRVSVIKACPYCNNIKFIKYGKYNNIQRYKCKECSKTFSLSTNTPWSYTKKNMQMWIKYIDLMFNCNTLKECANKLSIHITTAFAWRHKILHSLVSLNLPHSMKNYISMRKLMEKESFKGNKNMPVGERKKIWVIAGEDECDNYLAQPICKEYWDKESFIKKVYTKFKEDSTLHSYGDRYLEIICNNHNGKKEKEENIEIREKLFGNVFSFQKLKKRFYGIASKYLKHYLYFGNIFMCHNQYSYLSLFLKLNNMNTYIRGVDLKLIDCLS